MSEPVIRVEDLSKKYNRSEAVRGVSFQVGEGEFFGLLGPNGAGKTTLIGILTGWIKPTTGRVEIFGRDLRFAPGEIKRKIGLVPQSAAFYPVLTARENLAFFGKLYGLRGASLEARVAHGLRSASLENRADDAAGTFSGGMKRRLNIAIGLVHEPALLILDEPTAGVDTSSRNRVLEMMRGLNREGVTIVLTTHRIEEAEDLCSRVAILDAGRIVALDAPRELIQASGTGVIRLELHAALDDGLLREIRAFAPVLWMDEERKTVHLESGRDGAALRGVLRLKEERKIPFRSLDVTEPSLETVFMQLTRKRWDG